jgi:ATP-dependent protease ClpP protease subunit
MGFLVAALFTLGVALTVAPDLPPTPHPTLSVTKGRVVVVAGPIADGNLEPLGAQILAWSQSNPKVAIDIIIDSPGGSVITGFQFINVMEAVRARGTRLRCFVPNIAASMAFQLLLHCDERYVLTHSFLLWHGVRVFDVGGPVTAPGAEDLARDLASLDRTILRELDATLGLPREVVRFHFQKETLHQGQDLAELTPSFVTAYLTVPGLFEAMASAPRSTPPVRLFGDTLFSVGEIVYLDPSWEARP